MHICAIAERFVTSPAIAKDIAQEVVIKYWLTHRNNSIESERDYLFIMTKNASLNYLRSKKRENERHSNLESPEHDTDDFFNLLVEEEYNQLLIEAIDQLPKPSDRIIRYALSGLNNKEIALLLGISINTIKFMKYSAIKKLREYFATDPSLG